MNEASEFKTKPLASATPVTSNSAGSAFVGPTHLDRLIRARKQAAILICCGEEWIMPHFERLNSEIENCKKKAEHLELARAIAKDAAFRR